MAARAPRRPHRRGLRLSRSDGSTAQREGPRRGLSPLRRPGLHSFPTERGPGGGAVDRGGGGSGRVRCGWGQRCRRCFAREVKVARRAEGVRTARVLDADPDAPRPWMATEYVPAPSVAELVRRAGPLAGTAARWVTRGALESLAELHRQGIVHRDVKPQNLLLELAGPRLIDFGISHAADLTRSRLTLGTFGYIAPEQARGEPATPRLRRLRARRHPLHPRHRPPAVPRHRRPRPAAGTRRARRRRTRRRAGAAARPRTRLPGARPGGSAAAGRTAGACTGGGRGCRCRCRCRFGRWRGRRWRRVVVAGHAGPVGGDRPGVPAAGAGTGGTVRGDGTAAAGRARRRPGRRAP